MEDLFVAIVDYMHEALRFYHEGKFQHFLRALVKPFQLQLAPKIQQIEDCSTSINHLSVLLSQVAQQDNTEMVQRILEDNTSMKDMLCQLLTKINSLGLDTRDLQITAMIRATKTNSMDEPANVLQFRLSRCKRRVSRNPVDIDGVWRSSALKRWSTNPRFSFLLVQGSLLRKFELDAIGTQMAGWIGQSKLPVLFALRPEGRPESYRTTPEDIYRYLAMQALTINVEALSGRVSGSFNSSRLESATTEQHWESIIVQALRGLHEVYVVIELDLLERDDTGMLAQQMLASLLRLASACKPTRLKVAITSNRRVQHGSILPVETPVLNLDALLRTERRTPSHRNVMHTAGRRGQGRGASSFQARFMGGNNSIGKT